MKLIVSAGASPLVQAYVSVVVLSSPRIIGDVPVLVILLEMGGVHDKLHVVGRAIEHPETHFAVKEAFEQADSNSSGGLSRAEWSEFVTKFLRRNDPVFN